MFGLAGNEQFVEMGKPSGAVSRGVTTLSGMFGGRGLKGKNAPNHLDEWESEFMDLGEWVHELGSYM